MSISDLPGPGPQTSPTLKKYEELTQIYKQKHNGKVPVIHFFTITKYREKKLEELANKYNVFVKVYVIAAT